MPDEKVVLEVSPEVINEVLAIKSKKKEGHEVAKGILKAIGLGTIGFLSGFWLVTAINQTAGTTVLNATAIGLGLFGLIFSYKVADALER